MAAVRGDRARSLSCHDQASAPPASAAGKIDVTAKAGIKGSNIALTVATYANAIGIGATAATNNPGGAPGESIVTTSASSLVWAVGNDGVHATAHNVGPGQTLVNEDLTSTPSTFWVQSRTNASANTAGGGATVTINDKAPTAEPFNLVVVEIIKPHYPQDVSGRAPFRRGPAFVAS